MLPAPPGCHIIPRIDTTASRVKIHTAAWAVLGLMAANHITGFGIGTDENWRGIEGYLVSLMDSDSA